MVDPSDGLGHDKADVNSMDLSALQLLELMRDGIGHYHLWLRKDNITHGLTAVQQTLCCRNSHIMRIIFYSILINYLSLL